MVHRQTFLESAKDLKSKSDVDSPLVHFVLRRAWNDGQRDITSTPDDFAAEFVDCIDNKAYMDRQPPRTTTTQWNTYMDAFDFIIPEWHSRLAVWLNVGVTEGWAQPQNFNKVVCALKPRVADAASLASGQKESTREASEKVQRVRDRSKSAKHLAAYTILDMAFYVDTLMATFFDGPGQNVAWALPEVSVERRRFGAVSLGD